MAELADALDLGSSGNPRAGSTPVIRTRFERSSTFADDLFLLMNKDIWYINNRADIIHK